MTAPVPIQAKDGGLRPDAALAVAARAYLAALETRHPNPGPALVALVREALAMAPSLGVLPGMPAAVPEPSHPMAGTQDAAYPALSHLMHRYLRQDGRMHGNALDAALWRYVAAVQGLDGCVLLAWSLRRDITAFLVKAGEGADAALRACYPQSADPAHWGLSAKAWLERVTGTVDGLVKPRIPELLARFMAYRRLPGNNAWGSLHVVLDDGNTQNHVVDGCIEDAVARGDHEGAQLGRILRLMSRTQRRKLRHLAG